MAAREDFLEINGTKIKVSQFGEGFPIVLVHAGIADSSMWDDQIPSLSQSFRVITYDMRGFGLSPLVAGEYSHYGDLIALMDALAIDRCVLVGCSKGGEVIIDAALAAPSKVAGLVVVAGVARGLELENKPEPSPQWDETVAAFEAGDLERVNELEVQMWVDGFKQPVGRGDEAIREKVRAMNAVALQNEVNAPETTQKVLQPEAASRLSELAIPTLLITGTLDIPLIIQANERMVAEIPAARHHRIPNVAHLPNMEAPEEFNRLVVDFVKDVIADGK